jgi:hypothetical protein
MNNEPVVWIVCLDCGQRVTGDSIHTCSPQIKTLTDEEKAKENLRKLDLALKAQELTDEEIVSLYKETEADNGGIREFARAILRKVQEK